jgi:RNA polymerase sigma factor (sigma-70 family)
MDVPAAPLISSKPFQPRIQKMERCELERALEQMHPESWGWALACCRRDREMAEEALQNTYLRIVSGRARFNGASSLKTWVFGVIRMTAREEIRRRMLWLKRTDGLLSDIADSSLDIDAEIEKTERRTTLVRAMASLSRRQQEVLQLVFYHNLTIEDAARIMRISIGAARTHYERGKHRLAGILSPKVGA